ncbi:ankyrin repeat-containing domain protein [Pyronema domesticum]|nr:ankyrin repeat-containing domain protein [Pyronema domesticum]
MECAALFVAAFFGLVDIANILMEPPINADINSDILGCTSLYIAVSQGHKDFVRLILETKGIDIEPRGSDPHAPFLVMASFSDHAEIVLLLLNHGVDIESRDNRGQTALSNAAKRGNDSILRLLLEKGADVHSESTDGLTPFLLAAQYGNNTQTLISLLEHGADIESRDMLGRTALSLAALARNMETVQFLLEKGVDIDSKDNLGRTPLVMTAHAHHGIRYPVFKYLVDKGADVHSQSDDGDCIAWHVGLCSFVP